MAKVLENAFKIFLNFLIVLVVAVILLVFYGQVEKKVSGNNYSNYFGYTFFKVSSGSMGEYVSVNDVIMVKITKDVKVDDVITFNTGNSFTTHRVIDVNGDVIVTKGDANNTKDVSITRENVLGKVVHIFRGLEVWREVLSTPKVFITLIITLILFDVTFSYKIKERKKNERNEFKEKFFENIVSIFDKSEDKDKNSLIDASITDLDIDDSGSVHIEKVELDVVDDKDLFDNTDSDSKESSLVDVIDDDDLFETKSNKKDRDDEE